MGVAYHRLIIMVCFKVIFPVELRPLPNTLCNPANVLEDRAEITETMP